MARTKGTWGTVREVPKKGSGRFQASYVHGGVWGVAEGTRFTALSTFDTSGDAWAWIGRERDLIDRGFLFRPGPRAWFVNPHYGYRGDTDDWLTLMRSYEEPAW